MSLSPQRCHPIRFTLHSSCGAHFRVEEPRRDDVDASEISPFAGERPAEVADGGFGGVVDLRGEGEGELGVGMGGREGGLGNFFMEMGDKAFFSADKRKIEVLLTG